MRCGGQEKGWVGGLQFTKAGFIKKCLEGSTASMLTHFKPPASLDDQFLTVVGIWDKSTNSDLGFHWQTPTLLMSRD